MTGFATANRLVTKKGRVVVTELEVDELIDFWQTKYDAIFAQEARARRTWGVTRAAKLGPGAIEAEIDARKVEWDAWVADQIADLATAVPA